jgi:hypothetical protein
MTACNLVGRYQTYHLIIFMVEVCRVKNWVSYVNRQQRKKQGKSDTYCSVYSCCHATIVRRNMRFLVVAGKHANNTWAIARQLLGKWVPAAMYMHAAVEVLLDYNNRNRVFCGLC